MDVKNILRYKDISKCIPIASEIAPERLGEDMEFLRHLKEETIGLRRYQFHCCLLFFAYLLACIFLFFHGMQVL